MKTQTHNLQRSPIRNRPNDIQHLKSYISNHLTKRNVSPVRHKSPFNPEVTDGGRGTPNRRNIQYETQRNVSPMRTFGGGFHHNQEAWNAGEHWRHPSEICGNTPQEVYERDIKKSNRLFTNLLRKNLSKGEEPTYAADYKQRREVD